MRCLTIARRIWPLCCLMLLLAACRNNEAGLPGADPGPDCIPARPAAAPFDFPIPSQLIASGALDGTARGVSYSEADLAQDGTDYATTLPNNLVANGSSGKLLFNPVWGAPDKTLASAAYCIYHFTASAYDRNPQVRAVWSNLPADGEWFAGLARWGDDRWDWFAGPDNGRIDLANFDPYFDFSDNMLVAIVCLGSETHSLGGVRLGALPPAAGLTATPLKGQVPLTVTFNASASEPVEGAITEYEWDMDGDGSYEESTGTTPTNNRTYVVNTLCDARVRVRTEYNATDSASVLVQAVGNWRHSYHLSDYNEVFDVIVDSGESIYATGKTYPTGGHGSALLLLRLNATGGLVWARAWDEDFDDEGVALALAKDGTVVVAGKTSFGGASEILLQKWSKQGSLIWSKYFGGESTDTVKSIASDENYIYLCGSTLGPVIGTDYDFFACRCGGDGLVNWVRGRDNHSEEDYGYGMCLTGDVVSGMEGLAVVGSSQGPDGTGAWMVEYDLNGGFTRARELGAPAWHIQPSAILYSRNPDTYDTRYYITGELLDDQRAFLHVSDADGACLFATRVTLTGASAARDLYWGRASKINAVGVWEIDGVERGAVWCFDYDDGSLHNSLVYSANTVPTAFNAVAESYYGIVLGGMTYDNAGTYQTTPILSNGFSVSWQDAAGSAVGEPWTTGTDVSGTVTDINDELGASEDADGGQMAFLGHWVQ